jgi:hypothetical protein
MNEYPENKRGTSTNESDTTTTSNINTQFQNDYLPTESANEKPRLAETFI